jgi:mannose-1-phosphate guanylyltransferase (GDP) (EC 2.7.7.22)/mannose-6-phosphate isomerase, type 2 (EC 5.3.1.8)
MYGASAGGSIVGGNGHAPVASLARSLPQTVPAAGERFQVKRITVKPGAALSLQMHHHRAEHWIVVSGTAKVTRGEDTLLLSENQSTYIPLSVTHRLENPGMVPLELIEVQSGSYLDEDDIVRFENVYGRSN